MRKMTFIVSLFVSLMLTPLAIAQGWKSNEVTNRTTGNVYLVFSTWRPATQSLPEGYRITGHYRLMPNQTHEFYAFNNNAFYLQVWHPDLKVIKPTATRETFTAPVITDPFEMVLRRQISFAFRTNTILYRRPSGNYPLEHGFLRYQNTGTPINITSTWVNIDAPSSPIEDGPGDTIIRGGEETVEEVPVEEVPVEEVPVEEVPVEEVPVEEVPPVQIGAGQINLSRSKYLVEPGHTTTVTVAVLTSGGAPLPNVQVSLAAASGTINPTLITTNSSGQATSTYTAPQYTGTPHPGLIVDPPLTATVVDNSTVTTQMRIPIRYEAGSPSVSGVPSSLTSGQTRTITVTVKSTSGKPMKDVPVNISEGSRYISFSPTSGVTNSSGKFSTTLRTGGETSGARFTVGSAGGSRSYTVRVNAGTQSVTRSFTLGSSPGGVWECTIGTPSWHWTPRKYAFFPDRVLSYTLRISVSSADDPFIDEEDIINKHPDAVRWYSGRTRIGITVNTRNHCADQNRVNVTISATCRRVASTTGAPSLQSHQHQPQLRPEMDQLSAVWHDLSEIPSETALLPNYPNPFNPETWIPYHLAESAEVILTIYSADGRLVQMLALGHQPAGIYENKSRAAYWDGRNSVGERVASGLYFYTLTAGNFAATGKMLIMK